jgi:hypothetical protein
VHARTEAEVIRVPLHVVSLACGFTIDLALTWQQDILHIPLNLSSLSAP